MRIMGIEAIHQKPNTARRPPAHGVYPYLLRGMAIERPNQAWCADIRRWNAMCLACRRKGSDVFAPGRLVEVGGEKPASLVGQYRIDAYSMAPTQMSIDALIGDGQEIAVRTVRTFDLTLELAGLAAAMPQRIHTHRALRLHRHQQRATHARQSDIAEPAQVILFHANRTPPRSSDAIESRL